MLTISVWPRRLKEFLLTHPLYKSPAATANRRIKRHQTTAHEITPFTKGAPLILPTP